MWPKLLLAGLFGLMTAGAFHFAPTRERARVGARVEGGAAFSVMTWNVGYADLEADTRAHDADMPAVAETILRHEPDAVALQELTGTKQLRALLSLLHGRYRGAVADEGPGDRFEAVLVKLVQGDGGPRFIPFAAGGRYALGAEIAADAARPEVLLVSAHADAFNAARRRVYTEAIVDWARGRARGAAIFVAGDFNFELRAGEDVNVYTDSSKHDGEAYTYLLRYFRDLGRTAGDTATGDRRIDYVFGAWAQEVRVRRAEVLRDAAVGRMDHWPLLVEVAL